MACNGCKEQKERVKDARAEWEKKALPTISQAIVLLRLQHPIVANELLALMAKLNEITAIDKQTARQ